MHSSTEKLHFYGVRYFLFFPLMLCAQVAAAQEIDSVRTIDTVMVRAFEQKDNATTAVLRKIVPVVPGSKSSLVTALNTIAGVRMEERSPGSYRINIRGSSLRAPFGVRNVKVYWGGIPLTDPGGNTYFNQLAFNNFNSVTVFKGPASSMYGAGTGGLILIDPPSAAASGLGVEYFTGSYSGQHVLADAAWKKDNYTNTATFAHDESRGYREQSSMRRNNFSWNTTIKWNNQELSASLLYSDLYYQTPGALTLKEYRQNPRAARPKTGTLPSAKEAQAAIWQKNITAGVTHKQKFGQQWSNTTTLYSSFAQIKNSAIRNFEKRNEPHFGGRTVFTFEKKWDTKTSFQWSTGAEAQQGYAAIRVSGNKAGRPDTLQTDDDVNIGTYSLFTQGIYSLKQNWIFTGGVSFNKSRLVFTRLNNYPVTPQDFRYSNEVAPRFTVLKKLKPVDLLATVSRGFSPPTVAEILPSTTIINRDLKAEHGWNYELTLRKAFYGLQLEATAFYFDMKNALVQRRDSSGADYFTNAGALKQKGIELYGSYVKYLQGRLPDYVSLTANYTFNHFRYGRFIKDTMNYSGNTVPGVPANTLNAQLALVFKAGIYADVNYYTAGSVFLNDANAEKAGAYHLLGAKLGYRKQWKSVQVHFYAGADNLLNETYSLGNDINAAAGRYYNAAPARNYYAGAAVQLRKR